MVAIVPLTSDHLSDVLEDIDHVVTESYRYHMGYPQVAAQRSSRLSLEKFFGPNLDKIPDTHVIFAAVNGDMRGHIWIGPSQVRDDVAYIYSLFVSPPARGQGLGRKLVAEVEQWALDHGFHEIQLHVFASNTGAADLFVSSGYERMSSNMKKMLDGGAGPTTRDELPEALTSGSGRPAVIAPVFGEKQIIMRDIESAHRHGGDAVEWRVDLTENWADLRPVIEASSLPVIATVRTRAEGGEFTGNYAEILTELIEWDVACVDIEIHREAAADLITAAHATGKTVIGSFHDFTRTPSEQQMVQALDRMDELGVDVAKLSFMPLKAGDTSRQMKVGRRYKHRPLINISMGSDAAWSRLVPSALGSVATFASVRHGSAPGQLPIAAVRTAVDALANSV